MNNSHTIVGFKKKKKKKDHVKNYCDITPNKKFYFYSCTNVNIYTHVYFLWKDIYIYIHLYICKFTYTYLTKRHPMFYNEQNGDTIMKSKKLVPPSFGRNDTNHIKSNVSYEVI